MYDQMLVIRSCCASCILVSRLILLILPYEKRQDRLIVLQAFDHCIVLIHMYLFLPETDWSVIFLQI